MLTDKYRCASIILANAPDHDPAASPNWPALYLHDLIRHRGL
jgi:hypothetical protein